MLRETKFKVGTIIVTPNKYTHVLLVSVVPSVLLHSDWGKGIPLFGRFPLGRYLYELGLTTKEWELCKMSNILMKEAKKGLFKSLELKAIDNLTYIEILDKLKEHAK